MFMRSGYSAHTRSVRPLVSATQHHHRRADVLVRLGNPAGAVDAEPGRGALVLERRRLEVVEADEVLRDCALAGGVDGLADPAGHGPLQRIVHGHRAAGVDDTFDLAEVRPRRQIYTLSQGDDLPG